MKFANFKDGYSYRTEGSTGYKDLGNKGPQPDTSKNKDQLSLQGSIPASWSHYNYSGQSYTGYGKK